MAGSDRHMEKLDKEIANEVTELFEKVLDYAQIACTSPDTFKVLRSRILRAGNDCIRNLHKKTKDYKVEYIVRSEEVIEVKR